MNKNGELLIKLLERQKEIEQIAVSYEERMKCVAEEIKMCERDVEGLEKISKGMVLK